MDSFKITLTEINKEISKLKTLGIQPLRIILGVNQYNELSKITSENGVTFTEMAESNKSNICGLELIKLNKENNYFEIQ